MSFYFINDQFASLIRVAIAIYGLIFIYKTGMSYRVTFTITTVLIASSYMLLQYLRYSGLLTFDEFYQYHIFHETVTDLILFTGFLFMLPYYLRIKRNSDALSVREQHLATLLHTQTVHVVRTDLQGKYIYGNDKFKEDFAWIFRTRGFLETAAMDTVAPHHHDRLRKTVEECLRQPNTAVRVDLDKPLEHGGFQTMMWEFICLTDRRGTPEMIQCMGIDITERIRSEQRIQESELRYRTLFESIEQGVIYCNERGTILSINPAAERILGGTPGRYVGNDLLNIWPPSIRTDSSSLPVADHPFVKTLRNRMSISDIEIGFKPSGSDTCRWIKMSAYPASLGSLKSDTIVYMVFTDITTERSAQVEADTARKQMEQVMNVAPLALYRSTLGPDGKLLFISEYIEKITGYTSAHCLSTPNYWKDHIHPDDWDSVRSLFKDPAFSAISHQFRFRHLDGTYRWIKDDVVILENNGDTVREVIGAWSDITEMVQSKTALEQEHHYLTAIIDSNPVAFIVLDTEDRVTQVNAAFSVIFGYSAEEVIGRSINDLIIPERFLNQARQLSEQAMGGHEISTEVIRRQKDGRELYTELIWTPFRKGERVAGFAMYRDITSRVSLLKQLRESQELLIRAFDEAPVGMALVSPEGRWLKVNQSFCKTFQRTAEELLTMTNDDVSHPEDMAIGQSCMVDLIEGRFIVHEFEKRFLTKNNETIYAQLNVSLSRKDDGTPNYFIVQLMDITEKRRFEEVERRSRRLESLGTMASGIAHEINNILSPILTGTSLLKYKYDQPELRSFLEAMEKSAQRGSEIIKQILVYSRKAEGDAMIIYPQNLLEDFANMIHSTFPRNIHINVSVESATRAVNIDPTLLNQVLLNIAVNARDAMPNGGVLDLAASNINIDEQYARQSTDTVPGQYVRFSVKDNGSGMTPEVMNRIFDPFFTTKEFGKGVGLGLFSAISIVKNLGGFLRVESEPGSGTLVHVHIPAYEKEDASSTEELRDTLVGLHGNGETIFVVDDDDWVRDITSNTLKASGYNVLTAFDGTNALSEFGAKVKDVQVLLCDVAMPVLDGVSTVRTLRHMNPEMKIIMMTGMMSREHESALRGMGITSFLDKPFTAETLLLKIAEVLLHPANAPSGSMPSEV